MAVTLEPPRTSTVLFLIKDSINKHTHSPTMGTSLPWLRLECINRNSALHKTRSLQKLTLPSVNSKQTHTPGYYSKCTHTFPSV